MKKKSKAKVHMITREQAYQMIDSYAAQVAALPAKQAPKMAKYVIRRFKRELGIDLIKRNPDGERVLTELFRRHLNTVILLATEKFVERYSSAPASASAPVETVTCHRP